MVDLLDRTLGLSREQVFVSSTPFPFWGLVATCPRADFSMWWRPMVVAEIAACFTRAVSSGQPNLAVSISVLAAFLSSVFHSL
jgi:hypothetical protein